MATRRPLVYIGGRLVELPAADTLPDRRVAVSATAPATPTEGDQWFDTNTGIQYTRVGAAWVEPY